MLRGAIPTPDILIGKIGAVWYWVPEGYLKPNCQGEVECNKYDFAIMVLADDWGAHPGWSGYEITGGWSNIYRMDGYPGSGLPDSPAYCTEGDLYGDVNYCNFGAFLSFDANGQAREASMSCDGSRKMSGSSVYWMDWWFTGLPKVTGVYNHADSIATDCVGNSFPNRAGLITSEYASAIDYFNANFP